MYKFNNIVTRVIDNKPASEIKMLTDEDYTPNDFTALYDAIGQAIHETESQLTMLPETERPDKVMVVIITDGEEKASKEFSVIVIKSVISTHEELLHWCFIFMGSGLDNFKDALTLGINNRANAHAWKLKSNINFVAESSISYCMSADEDEKIIDKLITDLNETKN